MTTVSPLTSAIQVPAVRATFRVQRLTIFLPSFVLSLLSRLASVLGITSRPSRLSQYYQNPVFDSLAGVSIAGLLGVMGLVLTEVRSTRFHRRACVCRIWEYYLVG